MSAERERTEYGVPRVRREREFVGPEGAREDVTDCTDRQLVLRAVNSVLHLEHTVGRVMGAVSRIETKLDRDENEITAVRELRKDVRRWKGRLVSVVLGVVVIVGAAYLCARLGIQVR